MLKLMKYEFRKQRNTLLALLGTLLALEAGFLGGQALGKDNVTWVCVGLITVLTFIVFAYIILAGMASYGHELEEKYGYIIFMTPVSALGIVVAKLLFTALSALVAMAIFGATAWLDFRHMLARLDVGPEVLDQINLVLRFGLRANADVFQILRMAGYTVLTVLIEILLTMCTAFLAITLSATLLQNKKGFLRGLISLALFAVLTWGSNWLTQRLLYDRVDIGASLSQLTGTLGWALLLNVILCAAFTGASAWLLERKVNL